MLVHKLSKKLVGPENMVCCEGLCVNLNIVAQLGTSKRYQIPNIFYRQCQFFLVHYFISCLVSSVIPWHNSFAAIGLATYFYYCQKDLTCFAVTEKSEI
jgi:hypothetical protein